MGNKNVKIHACPLSHQVNFDLNIRHNEKRNENLPMTPLTLQRKILAGPWEGNWNAPGPFFYQFHAIFGNIWPI